MFKDRDSEFRELVKQGKRIKEIAEIMGVSYHTVWLYCQQHEIDVVKG